MAFVALEQVAATAEHSTGFEVDCTNLRFRPVLADLLPTGPAWDGKHDEASTLHDLLEGLAREFSRGEKRAQKIIDEADPRTTVELLEDWERNFGVPGECDDPATTIVERQKALHAKVIATGGSNAAYFEDIAAALGYTITITNLADPFIAGVNVCGDLLGGGAGIFQWQVEYDSGDNDEQLECLLDDAKPIHTEIVFVRN